MAIKADQLSTSIAEVVNLSILDNVSEEQLQQQLALEKKMVDYGCQRLEVNLKKANKRGLESTTPGAIRLQKEYLEPVVKGIQEFFEKYETGVPLQGKVNIAYRCLHHFEPEFLAYIALRYCFNQVSQKKSLNAIGQAIGRALEDEYNLSIIKEEAKWEYEWWVNKLRDKVKNNSAKRKSIRAKIERLGLREQDRIVTFTPDIHLYAGIKLIDIVCETTGAFYSILQTKSKNKKVRLLEAKRDVIQWITKQNETFGLLTPIYWPTIIPPKDWTSDKDGGYYSDYLTAQRFVRSAFRGNGKAIFAKSPGISKVLQSVNTIQQTPWAINTKVLTVLEELWDRDSELAGLPNREPLPIPVSPFDGQGLSRKDMTEEQLQKFIEWKQLASSIHETEKSATTKRIQVGMILNVANRYKQFQKIYFPHYIDFRGRVYPIPNFLNPQGSDIAKGLLHFAKGKAITSPQGAKWLAIQGANRYGADKIPYEERIDWVADNIDFIQEVAADPINNLEWTKADDPFQFLAWCFEWAQFEEEGYGFVSQLPIQIDGSCNGLQHFSAMLRDPEGGTSVNLVPAEHPADIYQQVANIVNATLEQERDTTQNPYAVGWLKFGIDRSITKRPVMVQPYGGTQQSCLRYLQKDYMASGKKIFEDSESFKALQYLSKIVWDSIVITIPKAREAMEWLRSLAQIMNKYNLPMEWTTPVIGLTVTQRYPDYKKRMVRTHIHGKLVQLPCNISEKDELFKIKQTNGIAPNFVHSMDSAAMMNYVLKASEQHNIRDFCMVHDSYGTHAEDTELAARLLREAFVELYSTHDVLDELYERVLDSVPDKHKHRVPIPPSKGSLDLYKVLESDYFFA